MEKAKNAQCFGSLQKKYSRVQIKFGAKRQSNGAWSGTDNPANCNKVEHDKILKYIGKLTQEGKNFENLPTSLEVTC